MLPAAAAVYYVDAANGSDSANGASDSPLRTIQAAADRMNAGDECVIRDGTYRETVTVKANNVTFRAAQYAHAVVSGADPVAGWTQHDGHIYKASMNWDKGSGFNQVFVNGKMVFEARWPNTPSLDVSNPTRAVADDNTYGYGSTARVIDAELPNYNWTGGIVNIINGKMWQAWTGVVTGSSSGRLDVAMDKDVTASYYKWEAGNPYFVTRVYDALDIAGEWFLNTTTGTLYLWSLDSKDPNSQTVEAKRRDVGFDLSGRSGVTIEGIKLFACTIKTDNSSSDCTINRIRASYVSHYSHLSLGGSHGAGISGILLKGSGHVLRDSVIAYSAGDGVWISGSGHTVTNCTVHDTDYRASYAAPIRSEHADNCVISYNRVYNTARDGILHGQSTRMKILNNEIYNFGLQCEDLGGTYCYGTDGKGTEIAYNVIYNGDSSGLVSSGVYIDDNSSNFNIHHNVMWKVGRGIHLNSNSTGHRVYNNTAVPSVGEAGFGSYGDKTGTIIRNNIFAGNVWFQGFGYTYDHNHKTTTPGFLDAANDDYRLSSSSGCVDSGTDVGLSNDILGTAIPQGSGPDVGAYEYTSQTTNPPPATPANLRAVQ